MKNNVAFDHVKFFVLKYIQYLLTMIVLWEAAKRKSMFMIVLAMALVGWAAKRYGRPIREDMKGGKFYWWFQRLVVFGTIYQIGGMIAYCIFVYLYYWMGEGHYRRWLLWKFNGGKDVDGNPIPEPMMVRTDADGQTTIYTEGEVINGEDQ